MTTEKRRLGRGLDALLGGSSTSSVMSGTTSESNVVIPAAAATPLAVPLDQIDANPYQPRKEFDADELAALTSSLREHGLLQPVVVRPHATGRYQLIAGERRLRAAKEVGWSSIPVRIVDFDDRKVFEAALVENLQRSDLNPIEKAQGFAAYLLRYGGTHEELAKTIGLDRSTITNLLRLLELPPEVQDAVRLGQITNGHARAMLGLDDMQRQIELCHEVISKGLSVRQVEAAVKEARPFGVSESPAKPVPEKTAHVRQIEDDLRQRLATKVEIRLRGEQRGQILIGFENHDDFERVLSALRPAG